MVFNGVRESAVRSWLQWEAHLEAENEFRYEGYTAVDLKPLRAILTESQPVARALADWDQYLADARKRLNDETNARWMENLRREQVLSATGGPRLGLELQLDPPGPATEEES